MNDFKANMERLPAGESAADLLKKYRYQPELTAKLDALAPGRISHETLLEIVLWKTNRYPSIPESARRKVSVVRRLGPGQHRRGEKALRALLCIDYIRLPMASAILRFANPEVFQIIDVRALRVLLPSERLPSYRPQTINERYLENCVNLYLSYVDAVREISGPGMAFRDADRILYQLDKALGHSIKKVRNS